MLKDKLCSILDIIRDVKHKIATKMDLVDTGKYYESISYIRQSLNYGTRCYVNVLLDNDMVKKDIENDKNLNSYLGIYSRYRRYIWRYVDSKSKKQYIREAKRHFLLYGKELKEGKLYSDSELKKLKNRYGFDCMFGIKSLAIQIALKDFTRELVKYRVAS